MNHFSPTVSVIILSYNRPAYLEQSITAALAQSYTNLEVVVVDNPSAASDEIARLVGRYPGVKLLCNPANLGYTGGMNAGLAAATGDYVLLTEDDIVADAGCVASLVEYMSGDASAGLVAPLIFNKESGTIRCAGGALEMGAVFRKRIFGAGERDAGQFARPFEVTHLDGATLMARTDFLRRLRGFRDEFFMYVESSELCVRVVREGKRLVVVPRAKVYHFEPPDKPTPPEIEFHKLKNFFALYLLHAPGRVLPEFFIRYAVVGTLRAALTRRGGNISTRLRALWWTLQRARALRAERRREGLAVTTAHGLNDTKA